MKYSLYKPGEVEHNLWKSIAQRHRLVFDQPVLMLPYGQPERVGWETRKLYFWEAVTGGQFNDSPVVTHNILPTTRIVSFGHCNVACPYCKRDCQFRLDDGTPIIALGVPLQEIVGLCEGAWQRGEIVRFSGGDPVMFARETLAIAEYMMTRYGERVSIAHNGTGPAWVERMVPYLSSAAIDLKAVPEQMGKIMGIPSQLGERMYSLSLRTQSFLSHRRILLDVRTPIFGDTSIEQMRRLATAIVATNDMRYTFWTWRMYKEVEGCNWLTPTVDQVVGQMSQISKEFPQLWLGMRAKWERGGMLYFRDGELVTRSADVETFVPEYGSGNKIAA